MNVAKKEFDRWDHVKKIIQKKSKNCLCGLIVLGLEMLNQRKCSTSNDNWLPFQKCVFQAISYTVMFISVQSMCFIKNICQISA